MLVVIALPGAGSVTVTISFSTVPAGGAKGDCEDDMSKNYRSPMNEVLVFILYWAGLNLRDDHCPCNVYDVIIWESYHYQGTTGTHLTSPT